MRICVTGGAGFIGSHIVESLVRKGAEVTVFDDLSTGTKDNLTSVKKDVHFIERTILDYRALYKACKGIEAISHQAGNVNMAQASIAPKFDLMQNSFGTINVIEAAKEQGVRKIMNASSACVYGYVGKTLQREYDPTNPNWEYGVSKLAAEKYGQLSPVPVISLRYANVYGPREWFRRVLTVFIKRVLNDLPPVIFGRGTQLRDFIYVDDLVRLHNLALESATVSSGIYNAGTAIATNIVQLAKLVIEVSGKSLEPTYEDVHEGDFSKHFEVKRRNARDSAPMVLDSTKAKIDFGWSTEMPLREGIKRMMVWAEDNLDRWKT